MTILMGYRLGNIDVTVEVEDVLDKISPDDIVSFYGEADILDAIGEDEAIRHFSIDVAE